jgi:hypothetical protein
MLRWADHYLKYSTYYAKARGTSLFLIITSQIINYGLWSCYDKLECLTVYVEYHMDQVGIN